MLKFEDDEMSDNLQDAWGIIGTILDLVLAVSVCFATFICVYVGGVFLGVWR